MLKRAVESVVSLFFPPFCAVCGELAEARELQENVCLQCWGGIVEVGDGVCFRCGRPIESRAVSELPVPYFCSFCRLKKVPYKLMRSLLRYQSPLREMIHLFKFEGMLNVGRELGEKLAEWATMSSDFAAAEVVAPVPLHPLRRCGRGFNQAEILARIVASRLGLPVSSALRRIRNTPPQSRLDPEKRRRNVRGAFRVSRRKEIKGRQVLLVDDITTTETTIRECSRVLRSGGASDVLVLTLSRSTD